MKTMLVSLVTRGDCRKLTRILATFAVVVFALTWTPALFAQQAPAPAEQELQEIVVTGTMIKRVNAETAEAITILKADVLKDLGIQNVEQALSMLTTNNPTVNIASAVGTFSGGGTFANLRGIGEGRTLVLLDGQRLANNANNGDAVDLSGIPFSSIDSVQVLREGASALYGSDAIAGVINFITKKNYQGGEASFNFDKPQQSGGGSGQAEFSLGHGDVKSDGYNVMITGSYSKQQELRATQRGFSSPGFDPAGGITQTNDPGTWPASILDKNGNFFQSGYPACAGNPFPTNFFSNCAYRYSAATDLLPQSNEASGLISFTKALPANNTLQLQYFYTRSEVTGWSGPMFYFFQMDPKSPYFPKASQLTCTAAESANCGLPPDLTDPIDAIWSDPNNNRYNGNTNTEQRVLLTFAGSNGGWDYSTEFNYSLNKNNNYNIADYPNEAVLAPGGVLSDLINPFGAQSAAGQALINSSYIAGTYLQGTDRRYSIGGHASHELGDAFNAGTPATVAMGADLIGERFAAATTPYNTLTQAATGLTDSSTEGSRNVQAAYIELDVPITKGLDLDISDRQDRYSDFGTTNNPKLAVRYQPASFLTLRATASTGFRAPTLFDLYTPNFLAAATSGSMGQGNPFCQPGSYNTEWSLSTCNTQGLGLNGGNSQLSPEKSQNFDFGVVVSPIDNMGITLDYYRIILKQTIGIVPATAIYGNPTGLASYIVTNSAGTLTPSIQEASSCVPTYKAATCGYVLQTLQNTGEISTDGFDLSIQYLQHTPIGTFHEDLEGTAVTQFQDEQYNGGPSLNLVGWYNHLPPAYRWQHNLKVDWSSPEGEWGGGVDNRFYSTYIDQFNEGPGNVGPPRTVGSYSIWNTYVSLKPAEKLTVLFGIKNLFDKNPPFTNANQNNFAAGYNVLVADPLLRNFYINLKYTFL
jgi:iron complex outermembrane recepter protein